MSPDIISTGELLIDFIALERNTSLDKVTQFQKFPGGAPSNVIIATSSLGVCSGLITKIGNDSLVKNKIIQDDNINIIKRETFDYFKSKTREGCLLVVRNITESEDTIREKIISNWDKRKELKNE